MRLPALAPKTGYVQHIARYRAVECGVVQRENKTQQCPHRTEQVQCVQHEHATQVQRSYRYCTTQHGKVREQNIIQ